jgi:hypothetical protein
MARRRGKTLHSSFGAVDSEILKMHRAGRSVRSIAAALAKAGVVLGKTAIAERLGALRDQGMPVRGARRRPAKADRNGVSVGDCDAAPVNPSDPLLRHGGPPKDLGDLQWADAISPVRLSRVSALIDANEERFVSGELPIGVYSSLIRTERDLIDRVLAQVTPEPPDPQTDPTNVQAANEVRRKLEGLVEAAERNFKCAACGANPYSAKTGAE